MSGAAITEKYEYKTDIITSYDGHEQRIKLRQKPRHFLSYDYPAMDSIQAQWLRGLGRIRQSDSWFVPMWQSPIYLRKEFVAGYDLTIRFEDMFSLRDCEYVEIFVEDNINQEKNIVRRVTSIQDGLIALNRNIEKRLFIENTWIYPLRRCSVQPLSNLSYIYSNGTEVTHNFEDLLELPAYVYVPDKYLYNDETYSGYNRWDLAKDEGYYEILNIEPTWADDEAVQLNIDKAVNRLDNETGGFLYDLKNRNSYDVHTYRYILYNQEMIHNMIRFFHRVCGMWKAFYYPTWVNDISVITDIQGGSNYLLVEWRDIRNYYLTNSRKKKIVIFTKDWKSYVLDIMTYARYTDDTTKKVYGKIFLQAPVRNSIPKSNILMISFLNYVRLDSDELQLNYESNTVANTTLVMKEVDDLQ